MLTDEEGKEEGEEIGPICVIDFRHCMWLPVSLMSWALDENGRDPLFEYSRDKLELQSYLPSLKNANVEALDEYYKRRPRKKWYRGT